MLRLRRRPLDHQLLQRRLDRLVLGGRGQGQKRAGRFVDRQLGARHDLLKGLQELCARAVGHEPAPSRERRRRGGGLEESVDRIGFQNRLLLRRDLFLHLLQHRRHQRVLRRGGVRVDPVRVGIEHERRGGHKLRQDAHHRGRVGHLDGVNLQFLGLGRCRHRGRRRRRFRHGLDDLADQRHDLARIGHLDLLRRRDGHHLAVRAQQGRNRAGDRVGRSAADGEPHADQLELPSLVEFFQPDLGHDALRNAVGQADHHQHAIAPHQCKTTVDQHAVHQVDCLDRGVLPGIDVIQRSRRRRFGHHERQLGLLGKPVEHLFPLLVAKHELEPFLHRLAHEVAVLHLGQHLGQLLVAFLDDGGPLFLGGRLERLFARGQKLLDLLPLIPAQLQTLGHLGIGQLLEVGQLRSVFSRWRLGGRWSLGSRSGSRCWSLGWRGRSRCRSFGWRGRSGCWSLGWRSGSRCRSLGWRGRSRCRSLGWRGRSRCRSLGWRGGSRCWSLGWRSGSRCRSLGWRGRSRCRSLGWRGRSRCRSLGWRGGSRCWSLGWRGGSRCWSLSRWCGSRCWGLSGRRFGSRCGSLGRCCRGRLRGVGSLGFDYWSDKQPEWCGEQDWPQET